MGGLWVAGGVPRERCTRHTVSYYCTGVGVYTNDKRAPRPAGRGIARSREEVRRIERPETGINNEYKQRLIQTKATTLKTTRHLNRGCSFVYFKLLCTRTAGTPSQFTHNSQSTRDWASTAHMSPPARQGARSSLQLLHSS